MTTMASDRASDTEKNAVDSQDKRTAAEKSSNNITKGGSSSAVPEASQAPFPRPVKGISVSYH